LHALICTFGVVTMLSKSLRLLLGGLMLQIVSVAGAQTRLSVTGAGQLYPIALPQLCIDGGSQEVSKLVPEVMTRDLSLSGYFNVVNSNAHIEAPGKCTQPNAFAYSDWSVIGVDGLVRGVVVPSGRGNVKVQMYLHDVQLRKVVLGKEYEGDVTQARMMAHKFANEIMKFFTGEEGIFGTQIAYVGRVGRFKELFVMDMDGSNVRQVTQDRGLALSPSWDPAGTRLIYTNYRERQPDVFVTDVASRRVTRVTSNPQLEVGPAFSKDGRGILMSVSAGRNSDIVMTDMRGNIIKRLTPDNGAIDVSADTSPDGGQIVFNSNRSGGPQIYTMSSSGGGATRVSFAESNYCTSPVWSPKGDKIAYVCRADGSFNVFTSRPDGSDAFQLTSSGNNEDPSWSPDGNYLAFSSTASGGGKKLAMIKADGSNYQVISGGRTEESAPSWGPRLF
jgi:TolB protein